MAVLRRLSSAGSNHARRFGGRQFQQELAAIKNAIPLPVISERYGIYLPAEQHCLLAPNYTVLGLKVRWRRPRLGQARCAAVDNARGGASKYCLSPQSEAPQEAPGAAPGGAPPAAPAIPTARSLPTKSTVVRGRSTARPPPAVVETEPRDASDDEEARARAGAAAGAGATGGGTAGSAATAADMEFEEVVVPSAASGGTGGGVAGVKRGRDDAGGDL